MDTPDESSSNTSIISELSTPTIDTLLTSSSETHCESSSMEDQMSSSMEESDSDDSMSLSSEESDYTDNDSSSDYRPSDSSDSDSSTIMEISDEESESEPETKKRKRNPLDTFCLYTIRPNCPNDINLYIGSTVDFTRRKSQHKKSVTNKRGGSYHCILYRYIRKCGGWDNFTMEKILDYPCETKHQGLLKEKEYIIKHEATLNSIMPVSDFTERMNDI